MRIYIFMVIAQRKLSVLSVKPMSAQIILSGSADTVSPPIPKRTYTLMQKRIICINRSAFSHRHMMRWIKAGGSDIPNGAGHLRKRLITSIFFHDLNVISASQRITIIFNQPQIMFFTKCFIFISINFNNWN